MDAHIVAWLYDALTSKLSQAARDAIEHSPTLNVSPMVRLELQYLHETGRIQVWPSEILDDLRGTIGLTESNPDLAAVIRSTLDLDWTRDTFDRLIVAEARHESAALITKDTRIREHYDRAIW